MKLSNRKPRVGQIVFAELEDDVWVPGVIVKDPETGSLLHQRVEVHEMYAGLYVLFPETEEEKRQCKAVKKALKALAAKPKPALTDLQEFEREIHRAIDPWQP